MKRDLDALANQTFDVLVIGGGIFGAGVARDAALRGLRVALVDKGDFASGTSSNSSKLIHGGFRYLEQYAFGLVAEASRERHILQRIAPHLVKPLPLLLPVYEGDPRPLWKLRLGMTLYDLLARYRNTARHRALSPDETLALEPSLARENLRGAILFYDCQEDDARFCIENILHAADCGAACANYCEVTNFVVKGERLAAARVRDKLDGSEFEVAAKVFINAAGPWVERVANLTPFDGGRVALSPTKGVHILLPKILGSASVPLAPLDLSQASGSRYRDLGIFFQARGDGRMIFVLPWNDCTLVGTTDTEFRGSPDEVRVEKEDVAYLLAQARTILPKGEIEATKIITAFAGVRALLKSDKSQPSARSREHSIVRHGENLLSIAGGKYTTYRAIAEQAVDAAFPLLGKKRASCVTAKTPLPQPPSSSGERLAESPAVFASDIERACEQEMAMTLGDVMRRRTSLALSRHGGMGTAEKVARIMQPLQKWSEQEKRAQLQQYAEEQRRALPSAMRDAT